MHHQYVLLLLKIGPVKAAYGPAFDHKRTIPKDRPLFSSFPA